MSNCGCSSCEDNLLIDPVVLNEGEDGSDGVFGGYSGDWLFESNTSSPPSTRYLRVNNASLASVTQLYINETNAQSVNYATFLAEFAVDSYIRIFREFNSNVFWLGKITSVTDSGAYYTIGVTTILTNGSFTNTERLIVSYIPAGVSSGSNVEILYNDVNTSANYTAVSASFDNILSYTVPANTLVTNGDLLKINMVFRLVSSYTSDVSKYKVLFNGADFSSVVTEFELSFSHPVAFVTIDFSRESNTQASVEFKSFIRDQYYNLVPQAATLELMNGYVFNTNPFDIEIEGKAFAGDSVFLDKLQIIKYTI
jgi:hypothetical protein